MGKFEDILKQDVEHGLFNIKNIINDEYVTPEFYKYVKELEEENKKLIDLHNIQNIRLIELKNENEKLKEQTDNIANINVKAQMIISELKQQIEKMKCCANCRHCNSDSIECDKCSDNCDKWELAEND